MSDIVDDNLPNHLRTALEGIIKRPLPRIQESDFVRYFLNGFAGEIENVPVERWLDVSGNAHTAVEVYNGDELLFVVPPLLGQATFRPASHQGNTMGEIIARVQKLNRIHPRQGEEYMRQALAERIDHRDEDNNTIQQWNLIFERYGKPKISLTGEAVTKPVGGDDDKPTFETFEEL